VVAARVSYGVREGWWVHLATLAFDVRHGVETRAIVQHDGTERAKPGVDNYYQRTPPGRFRSVVADLAIDPAEFTFVDVGCGKGAVLLLAAKAGFKRITGLELSPSLAAAARRNIASSRGIPLDGVELEVVCIDAAEWDLPDAPLVLFLFNPLPREPLRRFLERVRASVENSPRPVVVVYVYPLVRSAVFPELRSEFAAAGFLEPTAGGKGYVVYRAANDVD
jgi:SAM-dependent methyltransferase